MLHRFVFPVLAIAPLAHAGIISGQGSALIGGAQRPYTTWNIFQDVSGGFALPFEGVPFGMTFHDNRLYVANRGHNSIAGFAVDATTGQLTGIGHVSTEPVPSAFGLDPAGRFVFAAGSASGRLASYRINSETGGLAPLTTYDVGQRPMAVLVAHVGD